MIRAPAARLLKISHGPFQRIVRECAQAGGSSGDRLTRRMLNAQATPGASTDRERRRKSPTSLQPPLIKYPATENGRKRMAAALRFMVRPTSA